MNRAMSTWLVALLLVVAPGLASASDAGPPPRVLPISRHMLSRDEYKQLRDEWKAWVEAHPNDGHAWAQLAKAANYAGEHCDEMEPMAEKAYRLAPDDASACLALAWHRWSTWCGSNDSPDSAIALTEHAIAMDPTDVENARVRLWVMKLCKGDRRGAEDALSTMLDRGHIPEPLVDYNWNMLVGLAPNAILLTNGDNDTYPAIALQAARGFRSDVTVINLSTLNLESYRRVLRAGPHPIEVPIELQLKTKEVNGETKLVATEGRQAMQAMLRTYVKPGSTRPVYMAVTVPLTEAEVGVKRSLEGLVYRLKPGKPGTVADTARIARNLDSVYRMQSATSLALDWDDWSTLRVMAANYVAAENQLAQALARAGNRAGASRVMNRALALCAFHHAEYTSFYLDAWRKFDPLSPELARWSKQLGK